MIQKIHPILLGVLLIVLNGCNSIKKVESTYNEGDYVYATELAIKALRKTPKKARPYLAEKGPQLIDRLNYQGLVYMKRPREDQAIQFLTHYVTLLRELERLDAPIPNLDQQLVQAKSRLAIAKEQFVELHYKLGETAYNKEDYRNSAMHFEAVSNINPNYLNTKRLLKHSLNSAHQVLAIRPFFKHKDGLRANDFTHDPNNAIPLQVMQIPIEDILMTRVMKELNQKKSKFVSASIDADKNPIASANWIITGHLDAREEDVPGISNQETLLDELRYTASSYGTEFSQTSTFTYTIFKAYYKVTIELLIRLSPIDAPENVEEIYISKFAQDARAYRNESMDIPQNVQGLILPLSYTSLSTVEPELNRNFVIQRAIDLVSMDAAAAILEAIERN